MDNKSTPLTAVFISEHDFRTIITDCVNSCLRHYSPQQVKSESSDLLDIKGASQYLGISADGLYGKIHDRTIPFIKRKGVKKIYFSREALLKWLNEGKQATRVEIKDQVKISLQQK